MASVAFYHLEQSSLEQALPKLLEKTLSAGKRALVLAGSEERVESLARMLWTYDPASWLPHGAKEDGNPEEQPVWLSVDPDPVNGATFLFLTDGVSCDAPDGFERCFDLFDGHDESAVHAARGRWTAMRNAGHETTYWRQTPGGGWTRKTR